MSDFHAVICGGGVASAEALLRLRRLAGDSLRTTLIAPNDELIYRPLAVEEPFAKPGIRRYPLEKLVKDTGAEWVRDALDHVDLEARSVSSAGGQHVEFDALLLAVGARLSKPFPYSDVFTDAQADDAMHGLLQDIEGGYTRSVAFIQPEGPAWPLPLYELALMTSERAR
ncbi:MAG TPA: FAD-dependent oxidoreductase, partial [Thermoleophilaceae bacterium]